MTMRDIRWLIDKFGPEAKVMDVINVITFIVEMGEALRSKEGIYE